MLLGSSSALATKQNEWRDPGVAALNEIKAERDERSK
jgi:hypothetical protein